MSMIEMDQTRELQSQVQQALERSQQLVIEGSGSKTFIGNHCNGELLKLDGHCGVINYEPKELVISVRAGTPLALLEETLAGQGQMLAFEPPHFGPGATVGGTVAAGLSGPRRPFAGSARDSVLGVRMINGGGEVLRFGGEVMKNVAGYDLSRLMAGAFGTLGVLLEVSLKVVPRPEKTLTLVQERTPKDALRLMNIWSGQPLPLDGAFHDGMRLCLRLSGAAKAVDSAAERLGGERIPGSGLWQELREQQLAFFNSNKPLWRLSVAPAAPYTELPGKQLMDWAGALRWVSGDVPAAKMHRIAEGLGGHAQLFRGGDPGIEKFHPLNPVVMNLHRRIKQALDPQGIFNIGRIYAGL